MKIINKILCVFTLIIIIALTSCSDEDKDVIILRVTSSGSTFTGFYNVNAGSSTVLVPVQILSTVFEADVAIRDLDFLEVIAVKAASTSTLTIKVYRDEIKVKEATIDSNELVSGSTTDFKMTLSMDYLYGEEETTTTTTTTKNQE